MFGNVRLTIVADDVDAMIGACTVGEREMKALLARYGRERVRRGDREPARRRRAAPPRGVERIADGTYRAEWYVHDDGIDHDGSLRRSASRSRSPATRSRSTSARTDDQATGYVNAPLAVTISSVMIAFFMIADAELPHNDGIMRVRRRSSRREGILVNPSYPAPTGFGNHLSDQIARGDHARARAGGARERDRVLEPPARDARLRAGTTASDGPYVDILINACKGGGGGTYGADGYDHIGLITSGGAIAAQDPEMFEVVNPHLLHRFEYLRRLGRARAVARRPRRRDRARVRGDGVHDRSVFGDGGTPETAAFGILGGGSGSRERDRADATRTARSTAPRLKDLRDRDPGRHASTARSPAAGAATATRSGGRRNACSRRRATASSRSRAPAATTASRSTRRPGRSTRPRRRACAARSTQAPQPAPAAR